MRARGTYHSPLALTEQIWVTARPNASGARTGLINILLTDVGEPLFHTLYWRQHSPPLVMSDICESFECTVLREISIYIYTLYIQLFGYELLTLKWNGQYY